MLVAMEFSLSQCFSTLSEELCNLLYLKDYEKLRVNTLIDELNTKPYKAELFVCNRDATTLVAALCINIKASDELLAVKTSHLVNSLLTKQNLQFHDDLVLDVISWHINCLKMCSDMIMPDILYNFQSILQNYPQVAIKFTEELIGSQGLLINLINMEKVNNLGPQNPLQISLLSFKCLCSLTTLSDDKSKGPPCAMSMETKENVSQVVVNFLMKGFTKSQDTFLYYKIVIAALRTLTQLYLQGFANIQLSELIGICKHYMLLGLVVQGSKPEKIMPAQQTIAAEPVSNNVHNNMGVRGKKQKLRKPRTIAIDNLKKEIPVSDNSLMKDIGKFENNSAYKPASQDYFEPQRVKPNVWTLTSDSDMSDMESSKEAKLVALKSRVRQSASNLMLVLIKISQKKDIIGYWWALLPDSPDENKWSNDEAAKKTLAYCAVIDPIATSRASVLSVILTLLSGSRMYLSQAETSKKETPSFIPFSVTLGYIITCLHKVLVGILDSERVYSVILVALKCCAALVQATPYHKMKPGLVSELVRSSRKFLVHREIVLQVGALITIGCVLSVNPKIEEVLKAIEKHCATTPTKSTQTVQNNEKNDDDDCNDFEEGYSDDEMFIDNEERPANDNTDKGTKKAHHFKSWILDICFKNMGWTFRGDKIVKVVPAQIPVIQESLQIISTIAFHHFQLIQPHLTLLSDVLCEMLQYEHQEVRLQTAITVSMIGDGIQKLEQKDQLPPLHQCVYMWEKLLTPLSTLLQCSENPLAQVAVCDCVANIGERSFKELPRRLQVLCCALLVGSCSDEEAAVRAASVRALAMMVMYRSLREDICFVSDCGENILRALAEPTQVVRSKAAWALGTLSDALVLNIDEPDIEEIDDDLLLRLLEASVNCASDNDKVKMSAPRGLGNLLRLIKEENLLRNPKLKPLCETAIQKLLDCACKGTNMKVRWNACYAMGNAMKNDCLFTCFNGWQRRVFSSLCTLSQECKNLKVRINAGVALRAPSTRVQYGDQFILVWRGVLAAMEAAANVDDYTEFRHKDNLIEQLCVTLAHLCILVTQRDLSELVDPLVFHFDCARTLFTQLCHRLPPENASCLRILEAAKYATMELTATTDAQQQSLGMLQEIFIWDI